MARGVVGRELASDERNRQARINELLLNALKRLGLPVFRGWHKVAHDTRKVTGGYVKVQTRFSGLTQCTTSLRIKGQTGVNMDVEPFYLISWMSYLTVPHPRVMCWCLCFCLA